MECSYQQYDYFDSEEPSQVSIKFDKEVEKKFKKESNPQIKPKDIFINYTKKCPIKKRPIKNIKFGEMWL
tara:strand:+ start:11234 stop:11443 length:210 start_codon:yes stop_codon:yes gene_type:complete